MIYIFRTVAALAAIHLFSVAAIAQDYKIKPGDVLRIEVLEDSTINREVLVLPDGRISVPLVGTVKVGGTSVDQVRNAVTGRLAPNFAAEPTVSISLIKLAEPKPRRSGPAAAATMPIYLIGEVKAPGKLEITKGTTLLHALAQAGGFSNFAATKRVQLRRTTRAGSEEIYQVNYKEILAGRSNIGAMVLQEGDVIVVPQRKLFE